MGVFAEGFATALISGAFWYWIARLTPAKSRPVLLNGIPVLAAWAIPLTDFSIGALVGALAITAWFGPIYWREVR